MNMGQNKHGGYRKGAGRKRGVGMLFTLKKAVDDSFRDLEKRLLSDNEIVSKIVKQRNEQLSLIDDETLGWVYIIKNSVGYYKIGFTSHSNPKKRFSHYLTHDDIKIIMIEQFINAYEIEQNLHDKLRFNVVRGEWFNLNETQVLEVIEYLTKIKYDAINGRKKE